jgi:hypothetical protein
MAAAGELALLCRCGAVRGIARDVTPSAVNHCFCYCDDCQAFAHFLGRPDELLDAHGGSEIVQMSQGSVRFTAGTDKIAAMRLTDKGLTRWFASCCRTPIGNTARNPKLAYVGLVHTCLEGAGVPIERSFGPVTLRLNAASATGPVAERSHGIFGSAIRFIGTMLGARIGGSYKRSPFFDAASGMPVVAPHVLTKAEREQLSARP